MADQGPTFNDAITIAAEQQQIQMWRAAQLVTARVPVRQGRADVLDCLGLSEVVRPDGI